MAWNIVYNMSEVHRRNSHVIAFNAKPQNRFRSAKQKTKTNPLFI